MLSALSLLLLQVVVILIVARLFGALMRRIGQPTVIGEIVAGIALGPTLFGALAPAASRAIFPPDSFGNLKALAEIALILFMFQVGLDFDLHHLRGRGRAAVVISQVSIAIPLLLGVLIARPIFDAFAAPGSSFIVFALFMGVAMSITAFPVLARILKERGMTATPLGVMAITCAAVDDVTAWTLLGVVVILAHGHATIGVYAVFAAFATGAVAPKRFFGPRLNRVTQTLLPIFFAFSGLRTQIGLLRDARSWMICIVVIVIATVGKLGGGALAARICGSTWREALALGALMNTRGLMELVALNIGYELGILTPRAFAAMVIMAVTTTVVTAPLLTLFSESSTRTESPASREAAGGDQDLRSRTRASES